MSKKLHSNLFLLLGILFCTCLMIANICAAKLIQLGPIVITSGVLLFPITYILNDLIAEVYGYNRAKRIIWAGFLMNCIMVLYFQLAIALPHPVYYAGQESFAAVLGTTWKPLIASLAAYLVGSFINAFVMSKMKVATKGKGLMGRAVFSTLLGETADSLIFVPIMFAFVYDLKTVLTMIATQVLVKTAYEIIAFPVTKRVIAYVKKYEGVDAMDRSISYNPFNFKEV